MASVLGLPEPKCEIIIKSIIHILKAHGMPYSKQPKNIKISHICHFGLIEGKSLRLAIVYPDGSNRQSTMLRALSAPPPPHTR